MKRQKFIYYRNTTELKCLKNVMIYYFIKHFFIEEEILKWIVIVE